MLCALSDTGPAPARGNQTSMQHHAGEASASEPRKRVWLAVPSIHPSLGQLFPLTCDSTWPGIRIQ